MAMSVDRGRSLLLALALLFSCAVGAELPEEAVWIDTRTQAEYAEGHLPGAVHIPFDAIDAQIAGLNVQQDTPIYLYCARGGRAEVARETLQRKGFTRVTNVGGLADALALTGKEAVR